MPESVSSQDTRQTLIDTAGRIMAHKGFRAVGLNEVLAEAKVPKGSFYHYFDSKDAFGREIMQDYFVTYLANMDQILQATGQDAAARLIAYFDAWRERQSAEDFSSGCLAVTLGPEAANFADDMRSEIEIGVNAILDRLEHVISEGVADRSIVSPDPRMSSELLYEMWVGASIMAKISRKAAPFDTTMTATRQHLQIGAFAADLHLRNEPPTRTRQDGVAG